VRAVCHRHAAEYIAATDLAGKVHLFSCIGTQRYAHTPEVQFFPSDYSPLQYDQNHLAADDATGVCTNRQHPVPCVAIVANRVIVMLR
jgi:hypothetical protein